MAASASASQAALIRTRHPLETVMEQATVGPLGKQDVAGGNLAELETRFLQMSHVIWVI